MATNHLAIDPCHERYETDAFQHKVDTQYRAFMHAHSMLSIRGRTDGVTRHWLQVDASLSVEAVSDHIFPWVMRSAIWECGLYPEVGRMWRETAVSGAAAPTNTTTTTTTASCE